MIWHNCLLSSWIALQCFVYYGSWYTTPTLSCFNRNNNRSSTTVSESHVQDYVVLKIYRCHSWSLFPRLWWTASTNKILASVGWETVLMSNFIRRSSLLKFIRSLCRLTWNVSISQSVVVTFLAKCVFMDFIKFPNLRAETSLRTGIQTFRWTSRLRFLLPLDLFFFLFPDHYILCFLFAYFLYLLLSSLSHTIHPTPCSLIFTLTRRLCHQGPCWSDQRLLPPPRRRHSRHCWRQRSYLHRVLTFVFVLSFCKLNNVNGLSLFFWSDHVVLLLSCLDWSCLVLVLSRRPRDGRTHTPCETISDPIQREGTKSSKQWSALLLCFYLCPKQCPSPSFLSLS